MFDNIIHVDERYSVYTYLSWAVVLDEIYIQWRADSTSDYHMRGHVYSYNNIMDFLRISGRRRKKK